jgi:hypothetical protein
MNLNSEFENRRFHKTRYLTCPSGLSYRARRRMNLNSEFENRRFHKTRYLTCPSGLSSIDSRQSSSSSSSTSSCDLLEWPRGTIDCAFLRSQIEANSNPKDRGRVRGRGRLRLEKIGKPRVTRLRGPKRRRPATLGPARRA